MCPCLLQYDYEALIFFRLYAQFATRKYKNKMKTIELLLIQNRQLCFIYTHAVQYYAKLGCWKALENS